MKQNYKITIVFLSYAVFVLLGLGVLVRPFTAAADTSCDPNATDLATCEAGGGSWAESHSTGVCVCPTGNTVTTQPSAPTGADICAYRLVSKNGYYPCVNGCDPATGACLNANGVSNAPQSCNTSGPTCPSGQVCSTTKGYCLPVGVADAPCSAGCGTGLSCDAITNTCQATAAPAPNAPVYPAGNSPLPSVANTPALPCYQGTCPTGLCSVNNVCLPPSQNTNGIAASTSLSGFLLELVRILLSFAGVIAVVMLVIGGYWYMASGGNEELAEKGKKTIFNFVLGLALIILAYTIVTIVASTLTGGDKLIP